MIVTILINVLCSFVVSVCGFMLGCAFVHSLEQALNEVQFAVVHLLLVGLVLAVVVSLFLVWTFKIHQNGDLLLPALLIHGLCLLGASGFWAYQFARMSAV